MAVSAWHQSGAQWLVKLFLVMGDFMDEEDLGGLAMVETLRVWGKI